MGRKNLWVVLGLIVLWTSGRAQQLPQGGLYTLNPYVVNPALSGAYDFADARLGYRRQWLGLEDAPNTAFLTVHSPLGYGDKVRTSARTPRYATGAAPASVPPVGTWRWGAGAVVLADQTGPTERNIAQLTGAAHVSLPGQWQLSAGLGAGVMQYVLRFDRIQTATPSDPILPGGRVSLIRPFFSAGILARKGHFWGAASVLSPTPVSLSYSTATGQAGGRLMPHYYLTATYQLDVADAWSVFPQVWIKKVQGAPLSVDLQLRLQYASRFWGGFTYRVQDGLGAMLGLGLSPNLSLSYAYEYPFSSLRATTTGSHELLLGFRFNNRAAVFCPPMGW